MKISVRLCLLATALFGQMVSTRAEAPTTKWKYPNKAFPWVHIAKEEEVTMPAVVGYLSPGGVKVKVPVPRPLTSFAELEALNPGLALTLPGLAAMMKEAPRAAPEFDKLYEAKKHRVMRGDPLDEYNFFDCATVLRLTHPKSQRNILLIQSDMDVDTDGSDPVRFHSEADYADSLVSHSFLPMLSYRWDRPATDHPLVPYFKSAAQHLTDYCAEVHSGLENNTYPLWQRTIMRGVEEACEKEAAKIRQNFIRTERGNTPGNVRDMRTSSSLLGPYDPFIVLPSNWLGCGKAAASRLGIGDLAVVIVNQKIYPALVADAGPIAQCGEASLKICREIEPKASGIFRAVNGPKATYIVFPATASGEPGPLKTDLLRKKIQTLLDEIGGPGAPEMIHAW